MSDIVKRYTFNLRKTTTSVNFQIPINLEEAFKNVKPPVVPSLFKSVCEEILARIASRQLSILPSPLSVLFFNADSTSENTVRNDEIDDVIKMLHYGKKGAGSKQRALKRSVDLQPYRTSVLIRALFRYVEECSNGIHLNLEIPEFGYLLAGPPPFKADTKPDMRAYTRSVDSFLLMSVKRSPVKRDIFCYLMTFLSQIYQLMRDNYRSEPALCGMTRYILADRFGAEMIDIICTDCNRKIETENEECSTSAFIKTHIKPPYCSQVLDMMLEYVPLSYWREALNNPRRGLADKDKISTRISDLQFIVRYGTQGNSRTFLNPKPSQEPVNGRKSKTSVHDTIGGNGAAIKKSSTSPKDTDRSESGENSKSQQTRLRQVEAEETEAEISFDNGDGSDGQVEAMWVMKDNKSVGSASVERHSSVYIHQDSLNGRATENHKSLHAEANRSILFPYSPSPLKKPSSRSKQIINNVAVSSKMAPRRKKNSRKSRSARSRTRKAVKQRSVSNKKTKKKKIRNGRRVKSRRKTTSKLEKGKRKKGKAEERSKSHLSKVPRSKQIQSRNKSRRRR
ncbi:hypothetical protein Aperf_G00000081560 [Anoplocephala perfoliata]